MIRCVPKQRAGGRDRHGVSLRLHPRGVHRKRDIDPIIDK